MKKKLNSVHIIRKLPRNILPTKTRNFFENGINKLEERWETVAKTMEIMYLTDNNFFVNTQNLFLIF